MRTTMGIVLLCTVGMLVGASDIVLGEDVNDASGIFVNEDGSFVIVGNLDSKRYFPYDSGLLPAPGKVIALDERPEPQRLKLKPRVGTDLEDIDVLNGEVIVLCENTMTIMNKERVLVRYWVTHSTNQDESGWGKTVEEDKNRGLEGLAVWRKDEDTSKLAVCWEGGQGGSPRIYVHSIDRDVKELNVTNDQAPPIRIDKELLKKLTGSTRSLRVPALVFTPNGDGLILLLSGKNKWLARFDLHGKPIGSPFDLSKVIKEKPKKERRENEKKNIELNWEGLAWHGKHFVLISDNADGRDGPTKVVTVPVPPEWLPDQGKATAAAGPVSNF